MQTRHRLECVHVHSIWWAILRLNSNAGQLDTHVTHYKSDAHALEGGQVSDAELHKIECV